MSDSTHADSQKRKPILLGIAGGSGSGKTYLAQKVQSEVGVEQVSVLGMDMYFRTLNLPPGTLIHDINFDHPAHIDLELMQSDLAKLKAGQNILAPSYDFVSQVQTPNATLIEAKPVVIVDGLFVLANPIVNVFDFTCFLHVDTDQRLLGRLLRDIRERRTEIEWAIDRYQRFVRPSYEQFVEPTKQNADIVVDFTYRRSLFQALVIHLVKDYVAGEELDTFLSAVQSDQFGLGYSPKESARGQGLDLLAISKMFPEPTAGTEQPREPTLVVSDIPTIEGA